MTEAEPDVPLMKRPRHSGLPVYGRPLEIPSQERQQGNATNDTTTSSNPGVTHLRGLMPDTGISGPTTSGNHAEQLQRQLHAVEMLYRVYKVEHYAVLEEMRLSHIRLKTQGTACVKVDRLLSTADPCKAASDTMALDGEDEQQQPAAASVRNIGVAPAHGANPGPNSEQVAALVPTPTGLSIHSMVSCKRHDKSPPVENPQSQVEAASAPNTTLPEPAGSTPIPAAKTQPACPASMAAVTPLMQRPCAGAGSQPDNMSSSPPGVSLNVWVAPSGVASSNTPQSLRHHAQISHSTPRVKKAGSEDATEQQRDEQGKENASQDHVTGESPANSASQPGMESGREPSNMSSGKVLGAVSRGDTAQASMVAALTNGTYGDDILGYGSDDDPVDYTDIEDEVLEPGSAPPPDGVDELRFKAWTERFASHTEEFLSLEAQASAITQEDLDADGALASLNGRTGRFLIRRTTVLLGRGSETKGAVDVDLTQEAVTYSGAQPATEAQGEGELEGGGPAAAAASKVSRRQAFLCLHPDGSWWLENVGRRRLHVDGAEVAQFSGVALRHLALVEIGGVRLLFMVNQKAVQRVLRRSSRHVV